MFALIIAPATMSSLEIAQPTNKANRNVIADVRKTLVELHGEGVC